MAMMMMLPFLPPLSFSFLPTKNQSKPTTTTYSTSSNSITACTLLIQSLQRSDPPLPLPLHRSPSPLSSTLFFFSSSLFLRMEFEKRRRRKLLLNHPLTSSSFSWTLLFLCFFFAFFFLLDGKPLIYTLSRLLFSLPTATTTTKNSVSELSNFRVENNRIVFPDHVLLLLSKRNSSAASRNLFFNYGGGLDCIYSKQFLSNTSDDIREQRENPDIVVPVLSVDNYDGSRLIARCQLPPANYSTMVRLQRHGGSELNEDEGFLMPNQSVSSWESVAYAAALDGETAVVFVKGLNLRPGRASDPEQYSCRFNWGNSDKYTAITKAVTAAQEVIRCTLPFNLHKYPAKANGVRVSIGVASQPGHRRGAATLHTVLPSVAKLFHSNSEDQNKEKYELCVCTMVWNQASSLREWIAYHSWLGVERWFIYDNNSEDGIKEVIDELDQENYNVSRHVWPWIKTQEAGFSHCALQAKKQCKWVSFMDVDEFFYFPLPSARHRKTTELGYPGRHSLRTLVANFSSSTTIGEIRTACHSFGPSGLTKSPSQGVTVGYTCRLQSPERHKSIIRPDVLDENLINVVHHFHLKPGYSYLNLPLSTAMINHYKYQVWESFRAKFYRRVATYVADWQENQNEGSKDRAPGLGTEAIEPPNWRLKFCEVWDTGLRDFVMANLADPVSGELPWERSILRQNS